MNHAGGLDPDQRAPDALPSPCVLASAGCCDLGEEPLWDEREKRIFWIDILRGVIHWLAPDTGIRRHRGDALNRVMGRWRVVRYDPLTGKKLLTIQMPVSRPGCAVGGTDQKDLYITSAADPEYEDTGRLQPLPGGLFVLKGLGFQGFPSFRLRTEKVHGLEGSGKKA